MRKSGTENLVTAIKSPRHAPSKDHPEQFEIFPDYGSTINKRHMVAAAVVTVPLLFGVAGLAIRYAAVASTLAEPGFESYARALCRWDCHWYLDISERGYERFPIPNQSNVGRWGFFPFYPMLVAVIRAIFPFATILVATITSIACSYAACLVAWPLLEKNMRAYVLYCAFLLSGPFSFHFTTFLSEPLFVLLTSIVFLALKRSSYPVAGVSSALLSATRLVGVLVVFATVIQMFQQHRERGGSPLSFPRWVLGRPDQLVAIFISPAGLFAYILFLYVTVGDGFAFLHVQRAFGRVAGNPLLFLWDGLSAFPKTGWLPTAPQWSALAAIVGLALSVVLVARKQYGAGVFCAICILVPLITNLASMVRYVIGLAPLIMLMAVLLSASKLTWLAALVLFLVACYFMTVAWIGGYLALV
ncbi:MULTISPECIES: hypothetical protein [unclassified Mesorhizobium]|uniref:hypothetical protein n=1 Tax=unclassified Mesorhizobium TaxID=325217 RepID=UPI000FCA47F4|nr:MULTISPECIES: hypothetical protein [unclassified Mesorhizobium]RUV08597.1 hypothetical protein EOD00_18320 [Mesorhizobium sp. M7A.T.Ca.TU.009.01.3.1]RWN08285.1 MAG: hypothetical protein EOR94_31480 [Mesorhizobium sp.]RUU82426.1 hypothetical protein EOC06_04380 [Mesorhizobium sp. M7A.F.Ca.MR.362.00.0.0]RUV16529.1 hypothetical protein EOB80_30470 [Mesorhizobium sp. M7A.F.Ca.MR.245.00.0.0]RUV33052.1 hypothetical protein EOB49_32375 [Mesorhizobium sp. M7A.F.Ca.MR.148.00.0.0]